MTAKSQPSILMQHCRYHGFNAINIIFDFILHILLLSS